MVKLTAELEALYMKQIEYHLDGTRGKLPDKKIIELRVNCEL